MSESRLLLAQLLSALGLTGLFLCLLAGRIANVVGVLRLPFIVMGDVPATLSTLAGRPLPHQTFLQTLLDLLQQTGDNLTLSFSPPAPVP